MGSVSHTYKIIFGAGNFNEYFEIDGFNVNSWLSCIHVMLHYTKNHQYFVVLDLAVNSTFNLVFQAQKIN